MNDTIRMIKREEGFRSKPYKCTAGKLTIGYGCNLDEGLTEVEAEALLKIRVQYIYDELCIRLDCFMELPEVRQDVLINMAYQLGIVGLLKFKKTLNLISNYRYKEASFEMLNSKWAEQTPARANRLARIMRTGGCNE